MFPVLVLCWFSRRKVPQIRTRARRLAHANGLTQTLAPRRVAHPSRPYWRFTCPACQRKNVEAVRSYGQEFVCVECARKSSGAEARQRREEENRDLAGSFFGFSGTVEWKPVGVEIGRGGNRSTTTCPVRVWCRAVRVPISERAVLAPHAALARAVSASRSRSPAQWNGNGNLFGEDRHYRQYRQEPLLAQISARDDTSMWELDG